VRPRHGHNWDDRLFPQDDEAGGAGALGAYGGVTDLGTLREPPEAPWLRAMQGCQTLAGNRKT
jgi:hypothetical protein